MSYDHFFPNKPSKNVIEQLALLCRHDELKIRENCIPGLARYKLSAKVADETSLKFTQLSEAEIKVLLYARCYYRSDHWKKFAEEYLQRYPEDTKLLTEIESSLPSHSTVVTA